MNSLPFQTNFNLLDLKENQEIFDQHRALDTKNNQQEGECSAAEAISSQNHQEEAKSKNHHVVDILKFCRTEKNKTAAKLLILISG